MAAFRETDGSGGCPPTADPVAGYEIPFRFDSGGNLWITGCFDSFKFFGIARHDIGSPEILGVPARTPVNTTSDIISGAGISAGTYTSLNITNTTDCTLGILLGYDLNADLDVKGTSLAKIILSGRWNGAHVDLIACSSVRTGAAAYCRTISGNAANMHDPVIEAGGSASMTIAPGATANVGARLFLQYVEGAPDGSDRIVSSGSAVRVYGYVL